VSSELEPSAAEPELDHTVGGLQLRLREFEDSSVPGHRGGDVADRQPDRDADNLHPPMMAVR
jgi:hypothetical protein